MTGTKTKIRYGVGGGGQISQQAFMPGIGRTDNSELAALVTGDPVKAEAARKRAAAEVAAYEKIPAKKRGGDKAAERVTAACDAYEEAFANDPADRASLESAIALLGRYLERLEANKSTRDTTPFDLRLQKIHEKLAEDEVVPVDPAAGAPPVQPTAETTAAPTDVPPPRPSSTSESNCSQSIVRSPRSSPREPRSFATSKSIPNSPEAMPDPEARTVAVTTIRIQGGNDAERSRRLPRTARSG